MGDGDAAVGVDEAVGAVRGEGEEVEGGRAVEAVEGFLDEGGEGREVEPPLGDGEVRVAETPRERGDFGCADLTGFAPESRAACLIESYHVGLVFVADG